MLDAGQLCSAAAGASRETQRDFVEDFRITKCRAILKRAIPQQQALREWDGTGQAPMTFEAEAVLLAMEVQCPLARLFSTGYALKIG